MRTSLLKITRNITFIILSVLWSVPLLAQTKCNPEGNWLGKITASAITLRIGINVTKNETGNYSGYLISPDQSKEHFVLDEVSFTGDTVKFRCKKLHIKYKAVFDTHCDTISGPWNQAGEIPMKMWRVDSLPEMKRPQEPHPPYPYTEEEVKFPNKKGGFSLAGTLTYPNSDGPFPVVIMITGSGPQDRNEELLGHKPFFVIADYLTRQGIAVLRYDDRGVGGSGGKFSDATSFDFATDAQAAFDFLKTHPKIDPSKIGIMGHSEGGMIAPIVASKNKNLAFVILLAGPGTTGKQILISQSELIGRAEGQKEEDLKDEKRINQIIYDIIEKGKEPKKVAEQVRASLKDEASKLTDKQRNEAGLTDFKINQMVMTVSSKWFINFVKFNPQPYLIKISCPVLALGGEKDLQVPVKENLPAIENALKNGKCKDYTVKELPGLNHLFQHCTSGSPSEYAGISETFSLEALKIIGDWINEINKK
jgi:uncharacterized protein